MTLDEKVDVLARGLARAVGKIDQIEATVNRIRELVEQQFGGMDIEYPTEDVPDITGIDIQKGEISDAE